MRRVSGLKQGEFEMAGLRGGEMSWMLLLAALSLALTWLGLSAATEAAAALSGLSIPYGL